MKKSSIRIIAVTIMAVIFILTGCAKAENENKAEVPNPEPIPGVEENNNVNVPIQDNQNNSAAYRDPAATVLTSLSDATISVPALMVVGDKWPCDESKLQEAWKKYFPYMNVVYGPIAEDFYEQGLTWVMTEETLSHRVNEQFPNDNHIEMGIPVASENETDCINGLIHETGHIWLQNDDTGLQFDCGQWLWEAQTILFERLLIAEGMQEGELPNFYDLLEYVGSDKLNGVMTDGNKAVRNQSDFAASCALFYLDTVLSTPGTYDYWQKVSIARTQYCIENHCTSTNPEVLGKLMDEAADGKTIDGLKPSEWLFSRAVSETAAPDGTYLTVFGNYGDAPGKDLRFNIYGFTREAGNETGLAGQEVTVQIFDADGTEKGAETYVLDENGYLDKHGINNLTNEDFPEYSAVRIVATAEVGGQEITGTNYTILCGRDDEITATDNRVFFVLINEDETINNSLTNVSVEGAYNVETDYLSNGLLIVQVEQGQSVTLFGKTYSKPLGSRVIPIVVSGK